MRAIRLSEAGGPEVLRLEDVPTPEPGPGMVRIRASAIGVNFIDTYQRSGLYPIALPSGLGLEAAGRVEAVGEGVTRFKVGDRAAYCTGPLGAYAEANLVPADRAVPVPEGVADDIAAAAMLKGLTARFLCKSTFPVKRGDWVVVHAAAGGVGQILTQWAAHLGARVIAVVSTPEKAAIVRGLGAEAVVLSSEPIAARVREITGGAGAACVYDSVGRDTWESSLDCLAPLGMMVSYGNASGPVAPFSPGVLAQKGSLFLTRPTLFTYIRTAALLDEAAEDLFAAIATGIVTIAAPKAYRLEDAAQAHRDLEARATTGSLVLVA